MFSYLPKITKNIIIINVILFIITFFSSIDLTILLGAYYPESINFKPYQIITHMFMHGGPLHIFLNMYVLYMFGPIVERTLGEKRYFILYSLGGIGSFVLFNLVNYIELEPYKELLMAQGVDMNRFNVYSQLNYLVKDESQIINNLNAWGSTLSDKVDKNAAANWFIGLTNPMVGASGAISAVMASFAILFPEARLQMIFPPISFRAKYLIPITIGLDIYLGLQNNPNDNIAHFAHVGGAIVGIILAKFWKKNQFRIN